MPLISPLQYQLTPFKFALQAVNTANSNIPTYRVSYPQSALQSFMKRKLSLTKDFNIAVKKHDYWMDQYAFSNAQQHLAKARFYADEILRLGNELESIGGAL